jgi:type I restriction-modification system DNA methylase subunit
MANSYLIFKNLNHPMSFFQNSVLKKYLESQNNEAITGGFAKFSSYFHNVEIQKNIRDAKEEQFQEGFLRELFVSILGYSLNPSPNYNLTTEFKNERGAKKADGAIVLYGKALGVIELKGMDTKDLDSINVQAFNYKNNHTNCLYVITSNFQKLRFFINNSVEHIEFNLFNLTLNDFKLMWVCLMADNLLQGLPLKIKEESLEEEKKITKQLYKDYSTFRSALWNNMVQNNTEWDRLILFQKTQKLLDRFLFIFFAEDSLLLPPNSTHRIINRWKILQEEDASKPLYEIFKQYFDYINKGRKGKVENDDIFAYNGGLFSNDEILDSIKLDDDILHSHVVKLADYDFQSDIDVNILGHIFENSLTEIESITADLEERTIENDTSKKKKDGVFYTPKYITKFIVDNSIGQLCHEKRLEFNIIDEEYAKGRKNRKKEIIKRLDDQLQLYRSWLLNITICDPACGSGAFLNQALEFLIDEHAYIDELKAQLFGSSIIFQDVSNHILENNLFGVDINSEGIDIAKLSLWLRTAQRGRKLTTLNSNIKCGNSLIDDEKIAGIKAFNWKTEFPDIFENGGFDVVIGNPPYVPTEYISNLDKVYLEETFISAYGRINLYPIFYERGINLLKPNGILAYITPYTLMKNQYFKAARKFILENTSINYLVDFRGNVVFEDAAVDSIILILRKKVLPQSRFRFINNINNFQTQQYELKEKLQDNILKTEDLSFILSDSEKLIDKVSKNCLPVSKIIDFNQGIITGGNAKFITDTKGPLTKKLLTGGDFNRYSIEPPNTFIIYDTAKLHRPRKTSIFEAEQKILLRQTGSFPICMIDTEKYYTLDTVHNGLIIDSNYDAKYLLAILNSRLFRFLYENLIDETGKVFAQVKIIYIDPLPIKIAKPSVQNQFIEKVDYIIQATNDYKKCLSNFGAFVKDKYNLQSLSSKLRNWPTLTFAEFLKELKLCKITLSLAEESAWLTHFNEQKKQFADLKKLAENLDKDIDNLVYNLYGLTENEINSIKIGAQ